MYALTILQPWAWAIATGLKSVENRTWRPPDAAIGQLVAIHAGKRQLPEEFYALTVDHHINMTITDYRLTYGAVIAVARLNRVTAVCQKLATAQLNTSLRGKQKEVFSGQE
jgi:hypothetical protein